MQNEVKIIASHKKVEPLSRLEIEICKAPKERIVELVILANRQLGKLEEEFKELTYYKRSQNYWERRALKAEQKLKRKVRKK